MFLPQVTNTYWSGESPMPPQPPAFIKGMRHMNRPPHMRTMDPVRCRDDREKTPEEDTTTTIGKDIIFRDTIVRLVQ